MSQGTCVIGEDVQIHGRLSGQEAVQVDGRIEGSIILDDHLSVGEGGVIVAEIETQSLRVLGCVEGDVVAHEVIELAAGCDVRGTIRAPRINIEEGARFKGKIDMDVSLPS